MVKTFGYCTGISRVGDLLRQLIFPWLAFYACQGTIAEKVAFITLASLIQALPSLTLGNFSAYIVRYYSPYYVALCANIGLGVLSLVAALTVLAGLGVK